MLEKVREPDSEIGKSVQKAVVGIAVTAAWAKTGALLAFLASLF